MARRDDNPNTRAVRIRRVLRLPRTNKADMSSAEGVMQAKTTPVYDLDRPVSWEDPRTKKEIVHTPKGFSDADPIQRMLVPPTTKFSEVESGVRGDAVTSHTQSSLTGSKFSEKTAESGKRVRALINNSQMPTEVISELSGQFGELSKEAIGHARGMYHIDSDIAFVENPANQEGSARKKSELLNTNVFIHELGHRADSRTGRETRAPGIAPSRGSGAHPVGEGVAQGIADRYSNDEDDRIAYSDPNYWIESEIKGSEAGESASLARDIGELNHAVYSLTKQHVQHTGEIPEDEGPSHGAYLHKLINTSPHAKKYMDEHPNPFINRTIQSWLNTRPKVTQPVITGLDEPHDIVAYDLPISHYPHLNNTQFGDSSI